VPRVTGGGAAADRIDQLRERWRAEPSSRGFLQIAEEYRREGRLQEAVSMLDEGLKQQPTYLSALVAKGRCHLDLGQPAAAREALERVVRLDPTQPLANKLLVRTYLDEGNAGQARQRLDLYGMLHGGDPEIAELAALIRAHERGDGAAAAEGPAAAASVTPAAPAPPAPPTPPTAAAVRAPSPGGDVFALPVVAAAPPPRLGLLEEDAQPVAAASPPPDPPAAPAAPERAGGDVAARDPAAAAAANGDGEPFGGLGTAAARRRYLESLVAEGIFTFRAPAPAAAPAAPAVQPVPSPAEPAVAAPAPSALGAASLALWETTTTEEPAEEEAPWVPAEPTVVSDPFAATPAEPAPQAGWTPAAGLSAVDEWVAEEWVAPPAPPAQPPATAGERPAAAAAVTAPEPEGPPATVTLGQLYLGQGHLAEAERIFLEVLRREPGSRSARAGLEELARRRGAALAAEAAAPPPLPAPAEVRAAAPPPPAAGEALTAAALLEGFRPDPAKGGDTPGARKAYVLGRYLERLRRGSEPRVP
jgi:Tfp pilus assembly protein PilF